MQAARRGMGRRRLDVDGSHGADIVADIRNWDPARDWSGPAPDVIFAGPPCEHYSSARTRAKTPRNLKLADSLVRKTVEIIEHFHAANPACSSCGEPRHQHALEALGLAQALRDVSRHYASARSWAQMNGVRAPHPPHGTKHFATVCVENTKAPNLVLECILLCTGTGKSRPLAGLHAHQARSALPHGHRHPHSSPVSEPRLHPADPGPAPFDRWSRRAKRGGRDRASRRSSRETISERRRVRGDGVEDRPTDRERVLGAGPRRRPER
ncbi:hypothetical protein Q5P01_000098 [Channa striata]|uniref:Uncharacterized protein n=1 Tax=Channa striata TaxID=64152 RepID=A0AA88ICK0_CHASR|nr:hypothetical protein Q5P01_000098 [Channa striata]